MNRYLLAIDQGTTSSRAVVFDDRGTRISAGQQEFRQHYPADGWVEHDPEEIWATTLAVCREAIAKAGKVGIAARDIVGIGIANQRETTVIWERATGKPIHPAIVWQDRRTADLCDELRAAGHEAQVKKKTGLLLDPYFSATKLAWILDRVPDARQRAERGELAFGTIDSFLLWRLTGGASHLTDATNASRTMLFNIHTQQWDDALLALLRVPKAVLPEVRDCTSDFGYTQADLFGSAIPVLGMAGDQQAALVGQSCFAPGMVKSTYGTGCFLVMNTGDKVVESQNRLLSTIGYRIGGRTTYALEGSIFVAGATVQWLRDGLKLIKSAAETEALARNTGDAGGVYLVPAFTGLGAPYWDPHARGAIFGLTRDTGIGQIVVAGLQAVCYQSADLMTAMVSDGAQPPRALRVDGGMVANNWLVQFLADILGIAVERPMVTETTALGAACLAGLQAGVFASPDDIAGLWQCERQFLPQMDADRRAVLYRGWVDAVDRVRVRA